MNPEGVAPPVAVQEAPQPMEMAPSTTYTATEFLDPGESTALATLEQVAANPQSVNNIETALTLWSGESETAITPPQPAAQVEEIPEAEFTIEDTPGYQPETNTGPTPPPVEQTTITPQEASQKINDEIGRRSADAANVYDQLVYQYPDQAQQLADAGNEQAQAALNRRDELAKNPSSSTAMEVRASDQNVQRTELPNRERKQLTTEAGTGTELSKQLREVQTTLEQVSTVLEKVDNNEQIPAEVKEITFRLADAVKLLLLILINSMDMDFNAKQAAMKAVGGESAPVQKNTTDLVVGTSVTGGGERPQLEDKKEKTALAEQLTERILMLPAPTEPATPLEGPILDAARMLPGPVETVAPPLREPLQLTDNGGGSDLFTPSPALEALPVNAT